MSKPTNGNNFGNFWLDPEHQEQNQDQGQGQDQGQLGIQLQDQGQAQYTETYSQNGNGHGNLNVNSNTNTNTTTVGVTVDLTGLTPTDDDFADIDLAHSSVGKLFVAHDGEINYNPGDDVSFDDLLNGSLTEAGNDNAFIQNQTNALDDPDSVRDASVSNDGEVRPDGKAESGHADAGDGISASGATGGPGGSDATANGSEGGYGGASLGGAALGGIGLGGHAGSLALGGEGGDGALGIAASVPILPIHSAFDGSATAGTQAGGGAGGDPDGGAGAAGGAGGAGAAGTSEAHADAGLDISAFNQSIVMGANLLGNTIDMTVVGHDLHADYTSSDV